ncbi:MAG: hypothetical protein PsegKO_11090 [Pseudohongiellaceae bacterium]
MNDKFYKAALALIAIGFSLVFSIVVVPPLIENPDVPGALAAGFVNPYAAGYSADVLFCWAALAVLIIYERKALSVKYGWVCLLLGLVPGVAVGMTVYFLIRHSQIKQASKNA